MHTDSDGIKQPDITMANLRYPHWLLLLLTLSFSLNHALSYNPTGDPGLAPSEILDQPFPYFFPQPGGKVSDLFAMPLCNGVKIEEATIDQLQGHLSTGSLTSEQLVSCYLVRSVQTGEYIK